MKQTDTIIIGQGLAGTALAWHLIWSGQRVTIIDRCESVTASRIAAGLLTPVTGQRQTRSADYDLLWSAAETFYRKVEHETSERFFQPILSTRFFVSPQERDQFLGQRTGRLKETTELVVSPDSGEVVGYRMTPSGRLDTPIYLDASREWFRTHQEFIQADIDVKNDIQVVNEGTMIRLPNQGVEATTLVFCQGYQSSLNPWFPGIPDGPVRGDILRVRIDGYRQTGVVHQGVWVVPTACEEYLIGATYDRDNLTAEPSPEGRKELQQKLRSITDSPVEVIEHQTAVRAGMRNRQPLGIFHKETPSIGLLTGMGAKGALLSPTAAARLSEMIINGTNQRTETNNVPIRITELAKEKIKGVVAKGELVIDATAGNGHDTLFLAELTGETGRVIAYDVQAGAIHRSQQRLITAGFHNTDFRHDDHGNLAQAGVNAESVAAIMFNLGYLPGGDHQIRTSSNSTL
ncbi:MAG: FAD-dependent oxidoreductase, partial [Planctomyces sp.]